MEEQITAAQKLINTLIEISVNYGFQVLGAVIVLIAGTLVGKWMGSIVFSLAIARKLDVTLSKFLATTAKVTIIAFTVIIALGKFGITIAPFVAAIGAAAFGATYAIQGPLSNYGAGLSIILGRPFVVGDTITVVGVSGIVHDVKLASTTLLTGDGVKITIPNKHIVGEILQNSKANRVAEGVIGISYGSEPEKAIETINRVLRQFSDIVVNPEPQIGIQAFADSSVNIGYRYWLPTTKYAQTVGSVNLAIFKAFQAANIEIPFPQREVRVISQPSNL
ncbi:MAG: mechanosensitive ion channel protein MscS [Omnitrophica bacterium RIFCSPHIGHO2_02_FULL_46_11]|nr:MAG: mechanosensitive ion channel protein MscS [Omnitrophica bacterium RIFCSPHIGHO2_02_FULL_46_11]